MTRTLNKHVPRPSKKQAIEIVKRMGEDGAHAEEADGLLLYFLDVTPKKHKTGPAWVRALVDVKSSLVLAHSVRALGEVIWSSDGAEYRETAYHGGVYSDKLPHIAAQARGRMSSIRAAGVCYRVLDAELVLSRDSLIYQFPCGSSFSKKRVDNATCGDASADLWVFGTSMTGSTCNGSFLLAGVAI